MVPLMGEPAKLRLYLSSWKKDNDNGDLSSGKEHDLLGDLYVEEQLGS